MRLPDPFAPQLFVPRVKLAEVAAGLCINEPGLPFGVVFVYVECTDWILK